MLRMRPGGPRKDYRLPEGIASGEIMIGWARAGELLNAPSRESFKSIMFEHYKEFDVGPIWLGSSAGNMWRFLRDMKPGDLVLVPDRTEVFVARVKGGPTWDEGKVPQDTAFRRRVEWLNDGRPLQRGDLPERLQQRLKGYQTCLSLDGFEAEVQAVVEGLG